MHGSTYRTGVGDRARTASASASADATLKGLDGLLPTPVCYLPQGTGLHRVYLRLLLYMGRCSMFYGSMRYGSMLYVFMGPLCSTGRCSMFYGPMLYVLWVDVLWVDALWGRRLQLLQRRVPCWPQDVNDARAGDAHLARRGGRGVCK